MRLWIDLNRLDIALLSLEERARLAFSRTIRLSFLVRGLNEEVFMLPHDTLLLCDKTEDVRAWYRIST